MHKRYHNLDETLDSQKTPHISPSQAGYGVPILSILVKINLVFITGGHSSWLEHTTPFIPNKYTHL